MQSPLSVLSPDRIARRSANHPWLTLGAWVVLIVLGVLGASQLQFDETQDINGAESTTAHQLLKQLRGPDPVNETVIVQSNDLTVDDQGYSEFVRSLEGDLMELHGTVTSVISYLDTADASLVSADRHKTILAVGIAGKAENAADTVVPLLKLVDSRDGSGYSVSTVGDGSINKALKETQESDLSKSELIGLPVALVVLVIVFGAGVAAGVPLILGFLGIFLAVGLTGIISKVFGLSSVTLNMITMIGLAVGIDYTLFIVERFREERRASIPKVEAIVKAGNTASRAVLFSGITVIIALSGLLIVPSPTFQGLALGAITVVFSAVLIALTLLPAVLSLLGDRINWLPLPGRRQKAASTNNVAANETTGGFFGKTTALVQKHPIACTVASVAILLGAAAPYAAINIGSPGLSEMPAGLEPVTAFKVLDKEFSAGRLAPAEVVIKGDVKSPEVVSAVERLRRSLADDPAYTGVGDLQITSDGQLGAVKVLLAGDSQAEAARHSIERLRADFIPPAFAGTSAEVYVGGATAGTLDYVDTMNTYLPIVIGFVLTLSFLLLLMVFRSIVLPAKAIVMNLLSVGAAYGLVVLVFQEGVGADLFGFQTSDSIAAFLPTFLFTVLFGLSMDYHVFLLSRIQERVLHNGGDNSEAVGYGLRSTAHIITGAAAIMMAVFGGFAAGELVELQQMGFGLAVAVLIDATIVRSVLVPASMQLLGSKNWYLPAWLEWMPRISVEGPVSVPHTAEVPAPSFDFAPAGAGGE